MDDDSSSRSKSYNLVEEEGGHMANLTSSFWIFGGITSYLADSEAFSYSEAKLYYQKYVEKDKDRFMLIYFIQFSGDFSNYCFLQKKVIVDRYLR